MAFLALLVCSLLVTSTYSQLWGTNTGGGYGAGRPGYGGSPGGNTGGGSYGGNPGGNTGGGSYGGNPGGNTGGGSYGGNPGGNTGGGNPGGNTGGGSYGGGTTGGSTTTTGRCSCNLNCVDVRANGDTAKCQSGYTAVSCSCGMGCGTYVFQGSNTCVCQCFNTDWTSARCCKNT